MALLHLPSRRELLVGTGSLFAWAYAPKLARAEGRDPRVLVIVLRGALDGLAMIHIQAIPFAPTHAKARAAPRWLCQNRDDIVARNNDKRWEERCAPCGGW